MSETTIECRTGTRTVQAVAVCGDLAVTPWQGTTISPPKPDEFTVTHLPTGYGCIVFADGIDRRGLTRDQAVEILGRLATDASLVKFWAAMHAPPKRVTKALKDAAKRVQAHVVAVLDGEKPTIQ